MKDHAHQHVNISSERSTAESRLNNVECTTLLKACRESQWDKLWLLVAMALTRDNRAGDKLYMSHDWRFTYEPDRPSTPDPAYSREHIIEVFEKADPAPPRPVKDGGKKKPAKAKKTGPYKQPDTVTEGSRDTEMTVFAGWRRGRPRGDDDDALLAAMLEFNQCFDSMWSEAEVEKKWANYCRQFAQWEGEPPIELPDGMFMLPNDHMTFPEAARHIFLTIAEAEDIFLHGNTVSEKAPTGLEPLHPVSFQSRVDAYGKRVVHYIKIKGTDEKRLVPTRCSRATADVLLHTKEINLLPPVLIVTAAPVITAEGKTLGKGYHRDCGGVIATAGVPWQDKTPENDTKARMAVGRHMKKLFDGREVVKVDQFTITRFTKTVFSAGAGRNLPVTEYTIEDENDPCLQY